MKIKLFISTLSIICATTHISPAAITGPDYKNSSVTQEQEYQDDWDYTGYQDYRDYRDYDEYEDYDEKPQIDRTNNEQPDAKENKSDTPQEPVANSLVSRENLNCNTDSNGLLYCLDEKGKPYTGKRTVRQPENKDLSIENFKNGYKDGLCTYFDDKGQRRERSYYKQGIKHGMHKIYYSNNKIKVRANYTNGEIDGISDVYTLDGKLMGRMKYKKGYLVKGYCKYGNKKEEFSRGMLDSYPYNTIESCGIPL